MKITSTYSVRLRNFNRVFDDTVEVYRHAVDCFIELVIANWNTHFANLSRANDCIRVAEGLSVRTKKRLMTPYNFCHDFMKFPSYLRRAAIMAAYGQVSSYQTRLAQWKAKPGQKGRQPGLPKAGRSFPVMYRDNTFIRAGRNSVKLKVRIRNTWDWVDVELDKHDVDYIALHCATRNELSPALRKRGKKWYLDFSFEEKVILDKGSSSKALFNFAPRELLSITQSKFLCKRLFRVLLKSFLRCLLTRSASWALILGSTMHACARSWIQRALSSADVLRSCR